MSAAQEAGLPQDIVESYPDFVSHSSVQFQQSGELKVHDSACCWRQHYLVLSFLMSGHVFSEYHRLSGLPGIPPCSNTQWCRVVKRLEAFVTDLAEWSCGQVRKEVMARGDGKKKGCVVGWILPDSGPLLQQFVCHSSLFFYLENSLVYPQNQAWSRS